MNNKKIKILCLEDVETDAIIIREHLKREGLVFQFDHVSTEMEFSDKLNSEKYDIILSDYNLPGFSGIAALLLSLKICPEVPFICISGAIGEDLAVEMMNLGASDYVIKDKLSKLIVAIERALKEAGESFSRREAERRLIDSEARFRDIILSSYDWVWEIDRDWKYCYTSDSIENILGFTSKEVIGRSPFDFMPYDEKEKIVLSFSKIVGEKGVIKDLENWNIHKDGHMVCLLTNGFPIIDDAGNLIGYRGVDKDVTNRKLAEEEIRKLSRATEQSPVSILITDLKGNITYTNSTVTRLTGYAMEELIGKNPRIFSSGEKSKNDYQNLWETICSGKEWKGEFLNKKKTGELYWESASISPILDEKGKMTHYLAVKEDITERKKLTTDLIEAKVRAEASDKLKTAFLNNISHEVRTPLNGILGFSEFVLQPDLKQEEKKVYLEILNESSERLINTITNYMDISLLVSENVIVNLKPVDLIHIFDTIYEKFQPKCKAKNLEFIKQLPPDLIIPFICDECLLEKAISHLIDNAIKFTTKGKITFGINITNNELEIFVKDTGSGINQDIKSSVFDFFVQGEVAISRGYEGSGLGLSIARGLVMLMNGKIWFESEQGKGSTFYLTFQRGSEPAGCEIKPEKTSESANPGESPVILITEDDKSNSTLLVTILVKASFKYLLAFNGREALDLCLTHPEISLVIMDIKMPVMDGLEATRKIKEFRRNLPVIGLTANAMDGDKEKALEAGCDIYITKPVHSSQILSVINKLLRPNY